VAQGVVKRVWGRWGGKQQQHGQLAAAMGEEGYPQCNVVRAAALVSQVRAVETLWEAQGANKGSSTCGQLEALMSEGGKQACTCCCRRVTNDACAWGQPLGVVSPVG
jgi:hypothetical protein